MLFFFTHYTVWLLCARWNLCSSIFFSLYTYFVQQIICRLFNNSGWNMHTWQKSNAQVLSFSTFLSVEPKGASSNSYLTELQLAATPQEQGEEENGLFNTLGKSQMLQARFCSQIHTTDPDSSALPLLDPGIQRYRKPPRTCRGRALLDHTNLRQDSWSDSSNSLHNPAITTSNWGPGRKCFVNISTHDVPGIRACQRNKFFWQRKSDPAEKPF